MGSHSGETALKVRHLVFNDHIEAERLAVPQDFTTKISTEKYRRRRERVK
jgi:hypothetical protein